jgi:cytochrome c biogenesis protein
VSTGETLPRADIKDLGRLLRAKQYEVFLKDGALYGFKGIAGRLAPIGVHVSLVLVLFGAAYGALAGLDGTAMLAEGDQILVGAKLKGGLVGLPGLSLPEGARKVLPVCCCPSCWALFLAMR